MASDRRSMTVRVVALRSPAAAQPPAPDSARDRLRLVDALSASAWALTRRPLPSGARAELRCVLRPLRADPADRT